MNFKPAVETPVILMLWFTFAQDDSAKYDSTVWFLVVIHVPSALRLVEHLFTDEPFFAFVVPSHGHSNCRPGFKMKGR